MTHLLYVSMYSAFLRGPRGARNLMPGNSFAKRLSSSVNSNSIYDGPSPGRHLFPILPGLFPRETKYCREFASCLRSDLAFFQSCCC